VPLALFPDVSGTTLSGTEISIPRDLRSPWSLLVVTFRDDLDPLADKWVMMARRLATGTGGQLQIYELPVVGKGWRLFRPAVREAMKAQADDADERARTIPIHEDRKRFRKALDVRDDDTVHVFLVDQIGRIVWHGEGLLTPPQVAALEAAVGESLSALGTTDLRPMPEPDRPTGEGLPGMGEPESAAPDAAPPENA